MRLPFGTLEVKDVSSRFILTSVTLEGGLKLKPILNKLISVEITPSLTSKALFSQTSSFWLEENRTWP